MTIRDQLMPCKRECLLLESELSMRKAITIATKIKIVLAEAKITSLDNGGIVQSVDPLQNAPIEKQGYRRKVNEKSWSPQIQS